jgi:hypothetical protein
MTARRLLGALVGVILALAVVAPAYAYNGANKLHVRMSQPQHAACGTPTPVIANVATAKGDPAPVGTQVTFVKHSGDGGQPVPTSDVTDASGNAESTYTAACGAKAGARVIKACEPSGGCGTTVVVCRPKDGCVAGAQASDIVMIANVDHAATGTTTVLATVLVNAQRTVPTLMNLLALATLGLLAAGLTRGRPNAFRPVPLR